MDQSTLCFVTRLKELLQYNSDNGLFVWKIKNGRKAAGQIAGTTNSKGYVYITIDHKKYLASRLAFLYENGYWPRNQIDHKNRLRNDNRIQNLREATFQQNLSNRETGRKQRKIDLPKGVHKASQKVGFTARIKTGDKYLYLGTFPTIQEAKQAYHNASLKHQGEFSPYWT